MTCSPYVWSTPEWDWAAVADRLLFDDYSLRDLQQRLHPRRAGGPTAADPSSGAGLTVGAADPELTVQGTIRLTKAGAFNHFLGDPCPLVAMAVDGDRLWRRGDCIRLQTADGVLLFLSDGIQAWDFAEDPTRPLTGAAADVHFLGASRLLLIPRAGTRQQAGPGAEAEFAGHRCWVDHAPPIRTWIDRQSGQPLGWRDEHTGEGAELVDVAVAKDLDDDHFTWVGPARTQDEQRRQDRGRIDAIDGVDQESE